MTADAITKPHDRFSDHEDYWTKAHRLSNDLRRHLATIPAGRDLAKSAAEDELHKLQTDNLPILRNQIQQLRDAVERMLIGGNHLAIWRAPNWPDYGTPHGKALNILGTGPSYDMWCCWNAMMCARDSVSYLLELYPATPRGLSTAAAGKD